MIIEVREDWDLSDPTHVEAAQWLQQYHAGQHTGSFLPMLAKALVIERYGVSRIADAQLHQQAAATIAETTKQAVNDATTSLEIAKIRAEADAAVQKLRLDCELLAHENSRLKEGILAQHEHETRAFNDRITMLQSMVHDARASIASKESEIRTLHEQIAANLRCNEMRRLEDAIKERDTVIAQLRNTNHCKGMHGESAVKEALAAAFPDHAVLDTSSTAAESDIHLINRQDEIIAIECKYKATITLQDVEKSVRDVSFLQSKYGERFIGYMFLSLRTVNIPRKGSAAFEVIADVPVVWYGTNTLDGGDSPERFCGEIGNITRVAKGLAALYKNNKRDLDDVVQVLQTTMQAAASTKKTLEAIHHTITTLQNQVRSATDTTNAQFGTLLAYMEDKNISSHTTAAAAATSGSFACTNCNRVFKRKCDHSKHKCG